jgi:hypothetical protein
LSPTAQRQLIAVLRMHVVAARKISNRKEKCKHSARLLYETLFEGEVEVGSSGKA